MPLKILDLTGAGEGIRTPDLMITNQLLYQLSYTGFFVSGRQDRKRKYYKMIGVSASARRISAR